MPDVRESNWWQIVGAFKCGNSSGEIARLLEIPRSTVLHVILASYSTIDTGALFPERKVLVGLAKPTLDQIVFW